MSIAIVKTQLAEMKLFGMLGMLENALAEATRSQLSGSELLNRWCKRKSITAKSERPPIASKPPSSAYRPAFEDFDYTAKRSISRPQIKEIHSLELARRRHRGHSCSSDQPGSARPLSRRRPDFTPAPAENPSCSPASPNGSKTSTSRAPAEPICAIGKNSPSSDLIIFDRNGQSQTHRHRSAGSVRDLGRAIKQ